MTVYLAGNEVDIMTDFAGTISTDTRVALPGINRSGLALQGAAQTAVCTVPNPLTEFWFHIRLAKISSNFSNNSGDVFFLRNAAGANLFRISANRNTNDNTATGYGPTGASFSFTLLTTNLDVYCKLGTVDGIFRVWIDEVLVYELLGNVQFPSGSQAFTSAVFVNFNVVSGAVLAFSQIVFSSLPTFLAKVYSLSLSGGTLNQWAGTSANVQGTGFALLADGLKETAPDDSFLFAASDIPALGPAEFIDGVCLHASALFEVGSAVQKVAPLLNDGTTTNVGADTALTSAFTQRTWVYDTNPFTSAAWNVAAVNGLQMGLRARV